MKKYILEMFPYPSGNIHMGHVRNYVIGDIFARYNKLKGHRVIHPMGWDAFGLPAENAAIQNNINPDVWTYKNISNMKEQLQTLDLDIDWERELATCDESYYKQQQKIFIDFYNHGLVYKADSFVNWDPVDQTVLANEQVIDGKGWRTGATVEKKKLSQWFFNITKYAEELLVSLDDLSEWPEKVKTMQRNWIGKSVGAEIKFRIFGTDDDIEIYTTRPDTIFGATFIALSINHPVARKALTQKEVGDIEAQFSKISEKDKLGIKLKAECEHPLIEGKNIPIYIANFVLDNYGQGAIFGCPAHDQRDFDFANQYEIPIIKVVDSGDQELPFTGDGKIINSDFLDGLYSEKAIDKVIEYFELNKKGHRSTNYKLRDWGVSRQRYWGCPIPAIYYEDGSMRILDKDELPVLLSKNVEFKGKGNPLHDDKSWLEIICSKTGKKAFRETDTLDTFVDSSWYFIRFLDSKNDKEPFEKKIIEELMPVDKYIGGIEHAILHLLYARFFTKAIRDVYRIKIDEPFKELFTQGMITHRTYKNKLGEWLHPSNIVEKDGILVDTKNKEKIIEGPIEKMSKSKKNTVEPMDILENYGIDSTRVFVISDSPPDRNLEWTEEGIQGSKNLVKRIEKYFLSNSEESKIDNLIELKTKTFIFNIEKYINNFSLNKCIAEIYTLLNFLEKSKMYINKSRLGKQILICLAPIMPRLSKTLYKMNFDEELELASWPEVKESEIQSNNIKLPIQINGKFITTIDTNINYDQDNLLDIVIKIGKVSEKIKDKEIKRTIHVQNKIINIII